MEQKVAESLFWQEGTRRVQSGRGMPVCMWSSLPTDAGGCGHSEGASQGRWCVSSAWVDRQGLVRECGRGGVIGRGDLGSWALGLEVG